ncbi:MAG: glycoside hydrolase family 3 C-terminal domain-containing protein [Anaerolineae bacterium]|nr:glycoside hydrolase family 3 C-terminal domain-containing protein [Anaerolineae bacterium]
MTRDDAVSLADLRVRDPFIYADPQTGTYYLCVSQHLNAGEARSGVELYTSHDLAAWHGPTVAFETPPEFWAQGIIWAPELHRYQDKYYLFLTYNTDDPLPASAARPEGELPPGWSRLVQRSVQVLVADAPLGPYRPFRNRSHLPTDLMTLDGTLWVEDGVPYMVYCHEWVQVGDGTIDLIRLRPDLSSVEGYPVTLFRGSDAPWAFPGLERYVTDGPFLYRTTTGKLLMLWSTFGWRGYTTVVAESTSGSVHGPWVQQPRPLFAEDGGHAMVFRRFDGTPMVALHHPNHAPHERTLLFELEEDGDTLAIVRKPPTGYPFADPDLPPEARIDDLLSRLTLDEKIACLGTEPNVPRLNVWGTGHVEGLHGLAMGGPPGNWGRPSPVPTTQFPQAIGLGETWDPELVRQAAAIEGYETRYMAQSKRFRRGGLVVRAPNADLGRDIRWGRTEECYGEDAYLNGTLVTAFVRGLQGDHPTYWQTASLLKHFLANSNEDERTRSSSNFNQRLFREYYSAPFRMGIVDGGARAYMAAYNAYNGIPCTVHPVLKDVTVGEWGQDGIICTDGGAFRLLVTDHAYYPDLEMAAAPVIQSGINQFLDRYREAVYGAVGNGWLAEADIDAALRGVFRVMIKLGVLDPPDRVPYAKIGTEPELPWESEAHRAHARLVTQKSVVLLKNAQGLLPLDRRALRTIAVVGPRADQVLLDWYSGDPPYAVTPLAGIRDKVGGTVRVTHASDDEDAVSLAREADVAIVCVGNHPTGDAGWAQCPTPSDGKEAVDRRAIVLEQEELVKRVYRANPNTVVVLISSFPFAITWTQRHVPAIVHLTHNSQELGNALADVLFGDVNPGGRLVQTWPHSIDQLPPRLDYDLRNGRTYMYFRGEPLYPFGYGLSYTTFAYRNLSLSSDHLARDGEVTVRVDVTNTGARAGDEVVQLYVRHLHSTVERPSKELKGFRRITLQPGETQTVSFPLQAAALAYWDTDLGGWHVEADQVRVMIGASSADIRLTTDLAVG